MTPRDFDEWLENQTLLDFLDEEDEQGVEAFPLARDLGYDPHEVSVSLERKGHSLLNHHDYGPMGDVYEYVCFDLETTDRNTKYAEIVEIGAVRVSQGSIVDTFHTLVFPERPIDPEARAKHGITDDELADAPRIKEALSQFLDFVGSPETILVGHNCGAFDTTVLYHCALRHLGRIVSNNYVDTQTLAMRYFALPNSSGCSLAKLCARFGIDNKNAHRALSDIIATAQLYEKLSPCIRYGYASQFSVAFNGFTSDAIIRTMQDITGDRENVILKINKTNTKVYMFGSVAFSIIINSRRECIETSCPAAEEFIENIKGAEQVRNGWSVPLASDDDDTKAIRSLIQAVYEHYQSAQTGEPFACCNDYVLCSDARECIHKNNPDLRGCYYRKNLEKGHIIYGKNKNWP